MTTEKECLMVKELEVVYKSDPGVMDKISSPEEVWNFLKLRIGNSPKEKFVVLFLNNKNHVHGWQVVSVGTVSQSIVHPREVFQGALMTDSSAVIVAHNHPSGLTEPSREDITVTERLVEAGKILGIPVLDHVVITNKKYLSMKEAGLI